MHLAIVIHHLSLGINHNARIPRHAQFIFLHDTKTAPDPVLHTRLLKGLHLRAVHCAHYRVVSRHAKAVDAVLWKDDEVHKRVGFASLSDEAADMFGGAVELSRC